MTLFVRVSSLVSRQLHRNHSVPATLVALDLQLNSPVLILRPLIDVHLVFLIDENRKTNATRLSLLSFNIWEEEAPHFATTGKHQLPILEIHRSAQLSYSIEDRGSFDVKWNILKNKSMRFLKLGFQRQLVGHWPLVTLVERLAKSGFNQSLGFGCNFQVFKQFQHLMAFEPEIQLLLSVVFGGLSYFTQNWRVLEVGGRHPVYVCVLRFER